MKALLVLVEGDHQEADAQREVAEKLGEVALGSAAKTDSFSFASYDSETEQAHPESRLERRTL